MKIIYLILSIIVTAATGEAQVVVDPVKDFLGYMSRKPDDQLMELKAPVNRNGGNELFLTFARYTNGKAGYNWVVYAPVVGGYRRLDDLISFRTTHLYVGKSKELGGLGLLTYISGGDGRGTVVGYIFQGTNVKEVDIPDVELDGKDAALYERYFSNAKHPKIEVTPPQELPPL